MPSRHHTAVALAWLLACGLTAPLVGQEPVPARPTDIERMVREGLTEALETRLAGDRGPDALHLLAQTYANRGRQASRPADRQSAFTQANRHYEQWLALLDTAAKHGEPTDAVRLAAARVEYAGMVFSAQAAGGLDEVEISAGHRGDRGELTKLLKVSRDQYAAALSSTEPLARDLASQEEELLAAGVYDTLLRTRLDATLNLGWASYYLGVLEGKDEAVRRGLLATAERRFQDVIDGGQVGAMRAQCFLGRGMAQRELGRLEEAEKSFGYAMDGDASPAVQAQVRYELARSQIKAGRFDEGRTTLKPLVEKDPDNLPPEERSTRFYVNLAQLWFANSYLIQSEALRKDAGRSAASATIVQQARRVREMGLSKFQRLARRGGAWPALVQLYVAASVSVRTPLEELTPVEMLYSAMVLMDKKQYAEALTRLEAAMKSPPDAEFAADLLYELGRCHYLLKNERAAAETFAKLAAEHRGHAQAAQAATFAYALWGRLAEASGDRADYLQLAAVLRNLLESFADHPQREEAAWLLPVALQRAGRFDEAAEGFGTVPASAPHWEEAQFRRALCLARSAEAMRGGMSAEAHRGRIQRAADGLKHYAREARQRAARSDGPVGTLQWAAEADVAAAELLASAGVEDHRGALAAVESFESQYPQSDLLGRVLAVRIRAYRGLREFEQASRMLSRFLQAASPEHVGPTLAGLATGMQQEVQRLLESGQDEAARALAVDSVATFDELEKWVRADASRGKSLEYVLAGRARMLYHSGQLPDADRVVAALLERDPRNGNYQHLRALILTARLGHDAPTGELHDAQEAWAALLTDPAIRQRAPQRYWEARYHWLALALRLGRAADVESAITQERIWRPDLGGPPWADKLTELLRAARQAQGKSTETQPTLDARP